MFDTLQPILLGAAAVFDTVLLLTLLERRNWPFVRLPIVNMILGLWLWHVGLFILFLLTGLPGSWPWTMQGCCMLAMSAGLLLMPCGMIHGTWRVWQSELEVQDRPQRVYRFSYVPLLILFPLAPLYFTPGRGNFYAVTASLELPYFLFVGLVNLVAAGVFLSAAPGLKLPQARPFFRQMAFVLLALTALKGVLLLLRAAWPQGEQNWMFFLALSPLIPALLFAYFVIRYQFLQIILERTFVYGAILAGVLLLHQLVFQDVSAALPESYRLHLVFLEAVTLAALIFFYKPLRQRTAEALRYFLGVRVSVIRERLRQLARDLSARAGTRPAELFDWFVRDLKDALQVEYVASWLFNDAGEIDSRWGDTDYWPEERAVWLYGHMRSADLVTCSRRQAPERQVMRCFQETAAALAVIKATAKVAGLLVVGRGRHNRDLGEEETNAVLLLVEQLAITADNSILQAERREAERRALQNEKLSALGLLASSIAHEVKNPLSAIKTIATVLAEDLGPDSPHAQEVNVILGEVDRLACTTEQLLRSVRPPASSSGPTSIPEVLGGTLRLLRHLAGKQNIAIETNLADNLPLVQAGEQPLREIFLNLLTNSLEAAGAGGRVLIRCHCDNGFVVTEVNDNGPGIAEEVRSHLFEPFLTTKQNGTGLGLYVVGRHVGELGGSIRCESGPGRGTSFTVKLPYQKS